MQRIKKTQMAIMVASFFIISTLYCAVDVRAENVRSTQENYEISQVLNELFDALRSGDIITLKRLFAGEMYAKNKTLLEKNAGYPGFLKNHYRGAIFKVTEISPDGEGFMAGFTALFADGSKKTTHLQLERRTANVQQNPTGSGSLEAELKSWFIIKQVEVR
jgi:hypothetical protein